MKVVLWVAALLAPAAHAACADLLCQPGTTSAELAAAIQAAPDGATLRFAAGAYQWDAFVSFSNERGLTLLCEGSCEVAVSGTVLGMNDVLAGDNDRLYRISGFTFIGGGNPGAVLWFFGSGHLRKLRIDHNTFRDFAPGAMVLLLGDISRSTQYSGVVDNNRVTGSENIAFFNWVGRSPSSPLPSTAGGADNIFVEDNVIQFTSLSRQGIGCTELGGGATVVWRHNQTTNCIIGAQGVLFGGGTVNFELYENRLAILGNAPGFEDGYRLFFHYGSGELIAFNNVFSAPGGESPHALGLTHVRSAPPSLASYSGQRCDGTAPIDGNRAPTSTYFGYPCWHQPARTQAGLLKPIYAWNNRWPSGARTVLSIQDPWSTMSPSVATHVASGRDYFDEVPRGPIASRPASCASGTEAGGGEGFFATDEGVLYRCDSPGTWVRHYTPYTYPHPLRGERPDAGSGNDGGLGAPRWIISCAHVSVAPTVVLPLLALARRRQRRLRREPSGEAQMP